MRTLTKYTIMVLAFPFVLAGIVYGFCVGGLKAGLEMLSNGLGVIPDQINEQSWRSR